MAQLRTDPNVDGVDEIYARLVAMHEGQTLADSLNLAMRLNLILINQVGDRDAIEQAIALASGATSPPLKGESP